MPTASRPISATAASTRSCVRPQIATRTPSAASAFADAEPEPRCRRGHRRPPSRDPQFHRAERTDEQPLLMLSRSRFAHTDRAASTSTREPRRSYTHEAVVHHRPARSVAHDRRHSVWVRRQARQHDGEVGDDGEEHDDGEDHETTAKGSATTAKSGDSASAVADYCNDVKAFVADVKAAGKDTRQARRAAVQGHRVGPVGHEAGHQRSQRRRHQGVAGLHHGGGQGLHRLTAPITSPRRRSRRPSVVPPRPAASRQALASG